MGVFIGGRMSTLIQMGAEVSASVLVEASASFIRFTRLALLPVTTLKRSIFDKSTHQSYNT